MTDSRKDENERPQVEPKDPNPPGDELEDLEVDDGKDIKGGKPVAYGPRE